MNMRATKNERDQFPALYAIANVDDWNDPLAYVRELLHSGVNLLQIRSKRWNAAALTEFCTATVEEIAKLRSRCKLIVNDLPAAALASGADGVHLGQDDESPERARVTLGPAAIIGLSTHTLEQVSSAPFSLLDYIGFGPVFASPTKQGHAAITGIELLSQAVQLSTVPVVAIGGIDKSNAKQVFANGAASVAAVSALASNDDLEGLLIEFENMRSQAQKG